MTADTHARVLLALGWFTAATFVVFAVWARFPVPYRDDWEWLAWLVDEPPSVRRLFVPHNEHLIPLARALVWLQATIEGFNGHVVFIVAMLAEAGIVAVFWREIARRWPDDAVRRGSARGVALVLLAFAWQLQSVVFVAAILFPLVQVFAVVAFSCAAAVTSARDGRPAAWAAGGSLVAALGAMLATTNGIAVPATAAIVTAFSRRTRALAVAHAAVTLLGVALFVSLALGAGAVRPPGATSSAETWFIVGTYLVAFFAPFVTASHEIAGAVAGLVVLAIGVAVAVAVVRSGDAAPRLERFAVATMAFVFVSAMLAAAGRAAEYGAVQAAQSRYATLTVSFWAALVVAAMSLIDRRAAPVLVNRAGRLARRVAAPAAVVYVGVHLLAGVVWVAKTGNVATAGLALSAGVEDDLWIQSLHASPAFVYDVVARGRARGDQTLRDPAIGQRVDVGGLTADCAATIAADTTPDGRARRLSGQVPADVDNAWVIDARGTVIGLARPAPIADEPAPRPAEVAAIVLGALARADWPGGDRWTGFATAAAPAPLMFIGMAAGRPVCRSSIATGDSGIRIGVVNK